MIRTNTKQNGQRQRLSLPGMVAGLCVVLAVVMLAGCAPPPPPPPVIVQAPPPPPPPPPQPVVQRVTVPKCELPDIQKGRSFIVEAWAVPDPNYNVGEPLSLQLRVSTPAYVNMYHVGTSCKVTRLLHNVQVNPAEIADFPRQNSHMIIVKPPAGEEAFYITASRQPMAFVADADILQGGDGIASLDLSPSQFYQRLNQVLGRINPNDLSVTTLKTTIVAN